MMISHLIAFYVLIVAILGAVTQELLVDSVFRPRPARAGKELAKQLHGRFLHITDIHPDPFYKTYSSTQEGIACHRKEGPAGYWGAETSDCDAPISLVNATFRWIQENLKDRIDFVIWTGDSARHDNDEQIPRNAEQVLGQNQFLVDKFAEVFGEHGGSSGNRFDIPIIPTFGNNDILPHNLFFKGPNRWTKAYADIWRPFIPEEQRHGFDRGGWFYVEVIPNKLAVFSLNTMYFFGSNTAVDGCMSHTEPGYEHFEWLRIQLQFLRERGVKAIISGHVPPARNGKKIGWDETCWQKYALWMQQYRDVVVGSMYGHMNVEHFVLQDFRDIDLDVAAGLTAPSDVSYQSSGHDVSIELNAPDYLNALRNLWSKLPSVPRRMADINSDSSATRKHRNQHTDKQKFYDKIGGEYAERFSISHVAASVVPNFFSTLRVYEYNISGLEHLPPASSVFSLSVPNWQERIDNDDLFKPLEISDPKPCSILQSSLDILRLGKHKKLKRPKSPNFIVPDPPSKTVLPGPGYSAQSLSWIGYRQYFANNTYINNDFGSKKHNSDLESQGWNSGRYVHERPGKHHHTSHHLNLTYLLEYDTQCDQDEWGLGKGLTVRKWVELAARIGEYESRKDELLNGEDTDEEEHLVGESNAVEGDEEDHDLSTARRRKHKQGKHRKERKKRRRIVNRDWFAFVSRAVVATMDSDELHERFGEEY